MATEQKIKILAVVGPTASGKTTISVELAKRLGGEVVSCDSMQVYRRMNVGTAKPTEEEKCGKSAAFECGIQIATVGGRGKANAHAALA